MNFFRRNSPPKISNFIAGIVKSIREHPEDWKQSNFTIFSHSDTNTIIRISSIDNHAWIEDYYFYHSDETKELDKAANELRDYHRGLDRKLIQKRFQSKFDYFSNLGSSQNE